MNTQERQRQVAFHEREAARLQGEVSRGNFDKTADCLNALNKAHAINFGVLPTCKHDRMVANPYKELVWKCADCGYVYGRDDKDLQATDTPPCPPVEPQAQVNVAYLEYLTARKATLETAIRSACYWLSMENPKRALETLNQSLTA